MIEVGNVNGVDQAIECFGPVPQRMRPPRLSRAAVEKLHSTVGLCRWQRPGIGHQDLGAAIAIQFDHERPIGHRHVVGGHFEGRGDRCGPEAFARRARECAERLLFAGRARSQREDLGFAVGIDVGILHGTDRFISEVEGPGLGLPRCEMKRSHFSPFPSATRGAARRHRPPPAAFATHSRSGF